jgi:GNAT superfamily N-acetyltransferase
MGVRSAVLADATQLGHLHIETWQIAYADVFPEEFLAGLDVSARVKWFRRNIKQQRMVLVAESGDGLVGFCSAGEAFDPDWGEIYAIYVHPDHWGRGYGRELLAAAEDQLLSGGFGKALLWVLEVNQIAREFYERQGWRLGRPVKLEEIGGTPVTEVRYEKDLRERS